MSAQTVIHTSAAYGETGHHGEDTHNFLTDLGYGHADIQETLTIAETDPEENWFEIDEAREHAVRLVRKTGRFEVAEVTA